MTEEFKQKLRNYAEGSLSEEERAEVEKEIEKMEVYQAYIDDILGNEPNRLKPSLDMETLDETKEIKILRRGKWKARFIIAFIVLVILISTMTSSAVITGMYYNSGTENRTNMYQDVIQSAVALTHPNVELGNSNGQANTFFSMDLKGNFRKQIGDDHTNIANFSIKFLFNHPANWNLVWTDENRAGNVIVFPRADSNQLNSDMEWKMLEKIPDGNVVEVLIATDKRYSTDELLFFFRDKNIRPVWLAVDTGDLAQISADRTNVFNPIGFPYHPIWHHDDLKTIEIKEKDQGLFGKTLTKSGGTYPILNPYGDGKLREKNFFETMTMLQNYRSIVNQIEPTLNVEQTTEYLKTKGIQLYGVVVTGQTKEILKLKNDSWVGGIRVNDLRFWGSRIDLEGNMINKVRFP